MKNTNVTFNIHYSPQLENTNHHMASFKIKVDLQSLDRVITNLLNNAIKYTNEYDVIELHFKFTSNMQNLIIEISDTGVGITKEDIPYVFERLFKGSKAPKNNAYGSGLGLAIAKEIVELHQGTITAYSKDETIAFQLTIPAL